MTGQSYYDVQKLLCKVSRACAPKMQTVSVCVLIASGFDAISGKKLNSVIHLFTWEVCNVSV